MRRALRWRGNTAPMKCWLNCAKSFFWRRAARGYANRLLDLDRDNPEYAQLARQFDSGGQPVARRIGGA